ncbi:choline BCCT transporter BetT [Nocardiopsis salina]|uniref:choline BCCT transporter BetT n=1 Tax=Nocardiopsis salina TaxID=245836 RepID=UPI0003453246|nr:choline BCCT transporter BetT [Nocardiopsis salina]
MSTNDGQDDQGPREPDAEVPLKAPKDEAGAETQKSRLKPVVFFGSAVLILAISIWAIITPAGAENTIGVVVGWITENLGWYYFLVTTIYLVFVVYIAASRYGGIKLGPQHSTPDYSLFAWATMLFAAGIGIDLMFFSVSGPVSHYLAPPEGDPETVEAARQSVVWTLLHYGITGWAMYALMGMALGYFAFRKRLPLAIRSALYPLIGKRIHGRLGDAVDLAAIVGTIFGISVSLGIGVVQLNFGLNFLFGVPEGLAAQIGLVVVAVLMVTVSAVAGVDKGIRRLSELNLIFAVILMLYILILDNPADLLNGLVLNIGDYLSRFPAMTLNTFAYDQPTEWLNEWTLFFWAWWVAWAPFVGLFLARISRGRTIRQFVAATLVIPLLYTLTFLSIFGNSALNTVRAGNTEFGLIAMNTPEQGFYTLLSEYPGLMFSAGLATFVGLLLYVTSADSGALVMANLSSRLPTPTTDAAPWLRIFWSVAISVLTIAMLIVGGVDALSNATIIMGLPFSFVMLLIIWSLYKALRVEGFRQDAFRTTLTPFLSDRSAVESRDARSTWRQRLKRTVNFPNHRSAARFAREVCRPALDEVTAELREQGLEASSEEWADDGTGISQMDLKVSMEGSEDFVYEIGPVVRPTPSFAMRSLSWNDTYVRFEVSLGGSRQGYDVMGYTKEQLISNILDEYERHLEFLRLSREASVSPGASEGGSEADRPPEED